MGRPHWSAGEYERDRYYRDLRNTDTDELKQRARRAEQSGDFSYADDLYRAAGDEKKADDMRNKASDRYYD